MILKDLNDLLKGMQIEKILGDKKRRINDLVIDSRLVKENDLFVAIKGNDLDGHDYIRSAIQRGAKSIICMHPPSEYPEEVCLVLVKDTTKILGQLASTFWDHPSKKLKLVGVTGTNGKTTIATLLHDLVTHLGFRAGLLSTIENRIGDEKVESKLTTPDAISINRMLAQMVDDGCEYAFMEVSSHAIHQKRIADLDFDGGVFTNLTVDHLDYHNSFREYIYTKKKFFDLLKPEAFALINADDKNGLVMLQNSKALPKTYSLKRMADYKGKILRNSLQGLQMKMNQKEAFFKLIGHFNAYNLLAVYGVADLLGMDPEEVLIAMSSLDPAQGRFEILYNDEIEVTGIIDYAHTADALENVLITINELKNSDAKTITITGAGGDRDKTKRPEMGRVSAMYSDAVILTTDNPRSEEPGVIVEDMIKGVLHEDRKKILKILDRAEAIRVATQLASKGDVILIAGKGHESYQLIKGIKHPFDDKQVLKNIWF